MRGRLLRTNCLEDEVTRQNIELAVKQDRLLWPDLEDTGEETLPLLREVFKIHPLAVEDVKEFQRRPTSAPRRWPSPPCSSCSGSAGGWGGEADPPGQVPSSRAERARRVPRSIRRPPQGRRDPAPLTLPLGSLVPAGEGAMS